MREKWICLVGAACIMLGMALPSQAAEREGSVRVVPVWGGKQIIGGEVMLYRVGDLVPDGVRITDGLADWTVSEQEILSGTWIQWLQNRKGSGVYRTAQQGTGAFFEGLPEGLYLVEQREAAPEFMAFRPFLLRVPQGEQWDVVQEVALIHDGEPPLTGDRHVPLIGAMGIGLSAAILMVLADQRKK